jgi:hypothetical protein
MASWQGKIPACGYQLSQKTYQLPDNSTSPEDINTFGPEHFPVMTPAFLSLFYL